LREGFAALAPLGTEAHRPRHHRAVDEYLAGEPRSDD